MAVIKPIKHLVIEIHFREMLDFDNAMEKIRNSVRLGVQESKEVKRFSRFEHGMCYLKEFDCRIEEIDGVEHFIIPSKMNKEAQHNIEKIHA